MLQEPIANFDKIKLGEAAVLTENWQKENILKAFLFHKNDIECLAQQTDVVGVRFYIGITEKEDEEAAPDMIVVGVNALNEDVIYSDDSTKDLTEVSGIYDFALPCPKLCDPESELFHGRTNQPMKMTSTQLKTVQHSTEEDCMIDLGAISEQDAIDRVEIWQCKMEKELISIYFDIENLDSIFREFKEANALRVYFGLENGVHRVIIIGAKNSESNKAYYEDIQTEEVFVNTKAPCTSNGEGSCSIKSALFRPCNLS
ncbi:hypothetical protein [Kordia sp.]|uniref:hypothetical protein n=1 Tax=Kordia sp. TaxID=1965332 RepID=UPI003D2E52EA